MIIGTAGHIDHGKSALVASLTGRRMDRLAEEQRRGITIDLNFAPLHIEGLPPAGVVDVPGHEDFVRTMVAGASGIDLLLLVVDAAEGMRPQTFEHLAVAEQLGIPRGIPILTKADLTEPDWLELVAGELRERLAESPIVFGNTVITSVVTGLGLDELRECIRRAGTEVAERSLDDVFRMPVDRVFAVAGIGTVVTGTVWSGSATVGGDVVIQPGNQRVRVRSIESFGSACDRATPGSRIALGLTGVDRATVARGSVVLGPDPGWSLERGFDALVRVLPDAPQGLARRTRVRVHHGTAETMGRVYPREPVPPGQEGPARVVLESPLVLRGGDRFVLRRYSPVVTIGGGTVLDPSPGRARWEPGLQCVDDDQARLGALVARRTAGVDEAALPVLLGRPPAMTRATLDSSEQLLRISGRVIAASQTEELAERLVQRVEGFHDEHPTAPGISVETLRKASGRLSWAVDTVLARPVREGRLELADGMAAVPGLGPSPGATARDVERVILALEAAALAPPEVRELAAQLDLPDALGPLRLAAERGAVQQVERNRFFATSALDHFRGAVRSLGPSGTPVTPADLRQQIHLSRKFLIPLLEWSDRTGLTYRTPEGERFIR